MNLSLSTLRLLRGFSVLAAFGMALIVKPAHAAMCSLRDPTIPMTRAINMGGSFTVGADATVGLVLYRAIFAYNTWGSTIECEAGSYAVKGLYKTNPLPIVPGYSPSKGGAVYETGIAGIGAYVSVDAADTAFPVSFGYWSQTDKEIVSTRYGSSITVTLVRIPGPLGAGGVINGSNLPSVVLGYGIYNDASDFLPAATFSFVGSVNVVTNTCTTPDNVNVAMGTHMLTELTGVGSSTNWVPVNIPLTNCPAFFGYTNTFSSLTEPPKNVTFAPNFTYASINPINGVADATNGVMKLTPGGATGMGIMLADLGNTPVKYSTGYSLSYLLDKPLNTTAPDNYTLKLQARYYQTDATVTAGAANSTAVVTLTYN